MVFFLIVFFGAFFTDDFPLFGNLGAFFTVAVIAVDRDSPSLSNSAADASDPSFSARKYSKYSLGSVGESSLKGFYFSTNIGMILTRDKIPIIYPKIRNHARLTPRDSERIHQAGLYGNVFKVDHCFSGSKGD